MADDIEITGPGGARLTFRRIDTAAEWYGIEREARRLHSQYRYGVIPEGHEAVAPTDLAVCKGALLLHRTAHGLGAMTFFQALAFAKHAGALFLDIATRVEAETLTAVWTAESKKIAQAEKKLKADPVWRELLKTSRDVYRKHPDELTPEELEHCEEFAALARQEADEIHRMIGRAPHGN